MSQTLGATSTWRCCRHLDLLRIPVDLTDLQPALGADRGGADPLAHLRQQAKDQAGRRRVPDHAGPRAGAGAAAAGVLLQTLRALTLFRGGSHNLSNYLSLLGAQQGPSEISYAELPPRLSRRQPRRRAGTTAVQA